MGPVFVTRTGGGVGVITSLEGDKNNSSDARCRTLGTGFVRCRYYILFDMFGNCWPQEIRTEVTGAGIPNPAHVCPGSPPRYLGLR